MVRRNRHDVLVRRPHFAGGVEYHRRTSDGYIWQPSLRDNHGDTGSLAPSLPARRDRDRGYHTRRGCRRPCAMATADSIRFRRSSLVKRVLQLLGSTLVVLAVMVAVFAIDSKELPVTVTGALVLPSHGSFPAGSQGTPAAIFPWIHQFGTNSSDFGNAVAVVGSDIYVAGSTIGTFPGEMNAGYIDAFVRRYDSSGTEVWTRQFGTSSDDGAVSVAIQGSSVLVAGYTFGTFPGLTNQGSRDAFLRNYDASGTERWTRQVGTPADDLPYGVAADASAVYVAGYTYGAFPGNTNPGDQDAFLQSYDASGDERWIRQFGTSSFDVASAVAANSFGVY